MKTLISFTCALLCALGAQAVEPLGPDLTLEDFKLAGELTNGQANFILTAVARVNSSKGGAVELLSGSVALTEVADNPRWTIRPEENRFVLVVDRRGVYPIRIKFSAAVAQLDGWRRVNFGVLPTALQPISLSGWPKDTEFDFPGAARLEANGSTFSSYLPADGRVGLAWKETRPETEGKLFFAAEMLSQISVSPGLMRQVALLDFKVMQGELTRVTLQLQGEGEVTRVQGEHLIAWNLEPVPGSKSRRLVLQFNQPQKDQFSLQIQMQTALGSFPQSSDVLTLQPDGATRFAGYFRIVNEGAVRLGVLRASGLTQVSPEQFPESDTTRSALRASGNQRFVYRFSGTDFALRIQADQIVPELTVSEIVAYRLGENDLAIDSEIEVDVREAPLRELLLRVPKGYAVARLSAAGLADYFLVEPKDEGQAELRLVFSQPVSGRQVIELRLERNKALGEATWVLPHLEVAKAKSTRGHIGVAADAGFRLTPERTQGLTEVATAFFPRKVAGLQSASRLSDISWQAAFRVERLPQTVQADAFHLFSIGEGIAYGSSLINYTVSGAPISVLKIQLSSEYFNVEFTGKDVRNWQRTPDGYLVQLQTPASGAYTLLATYERPFKTQGDALTFTGARPLDAASEQGHTLVVSAYQFQVRPEEISPGLLALEPGEVPPEYRLFFDVPVLSAYRYVSRPFNLKLALTPLAQGDSLGQVVDRAVLRTRISKEGQILTDVRYLVKSRGKPHLPIKLPDGTELWSAAVNGAPVVPVIDAGTQIIPLPQTTDPNAVIRLDLKLAAKAKAQSVLRVAAPIVSAPVMLAEWKLEPDEGQRLIYRGGSLRPASGSAEVSGFSQLVRTFSGDQAWRAWLWWAGMIGLFLLGSILWRSAASSRQDGLSPRAATGFLLTLTAAVVAFVSLSHLLELTAQHRSYAPREITLLAPIQQTGSVLSVEVANTAEQQSALSVFSTVWPALLALPLWLYAWASPKVSRRQTAWAAGWALLTWAALRQPNGASSFLILLAAFASLHFLLPIVLHIARLARGGRLPPSTKAAGASATAALLAGSIVWLSACSIGCAAPTAAVDPPPQTVARPDPAPSIAESVIQEIQVEGEFVLATAKIHWQAEKGDSLPLLYESAVLTGLRYPSNVLKLVRGPVLKSGRQDGSLTNSAATRELLAQKRGTFDIELHYQIRVERRDGETGFALPVNYGLVNRLRLTVMNADVEVASREAPSVQRTTVGTNTVATLVLAPSRDTWIGWKPRSRDLAGEKAVFYAEVSQLYVPAAGVIEAVHQVSIRPAQGELTELGLDVPAGASITDVMEAPDPSQPGRASAVALWRFDPDLRKLRVTFTAPQSRPLSLFVRSQFAAGPLPLEHSVGLLKVSGASDQIGFLGVGTSNDVQLDSTVGEGFSPINLEDFPTDLAARLQSTATGITVRRAFRYADTQATATLKASAVEPDIRVETRETVSLGEDRTVLAVEAGVEITRAGIFRLSFILPPAFAPESISGSALSHWTELKTEGGQVITLHLNGKTEGHHQFAITLAGPGLRSAQSWPVPQLVLREATKQRGTILLVPEQGLRLQPVDQQGVTQLDPQKSGINQKGMLAFRVLQTPHVLSLNIEQVDPWIQVTSLQQATVADAHVSIAQNLQYQIDNTGVKSFRVLVPTNAEAVRFHGEQIADFLPEPGVVTNGLQSWIVRLHRRVIGPYFLAAAYQIPLPQNAPEVLLRGTRALDVNLQRGFVTVRSAGRLQVRVDLLPSALQPTEGQSIPRALQQGLSSGAAEFSYRLVDPAFELPLHLERHEAAKLLPAHVNRISFNSVISDDGVMLTQVRLELLPGDKRLLGFTLPPKAHFWFAFANQSGVWPWREQERILIPLEQEARGNKPMTVELFYSCQVGRAGARSLDLDLVAPKFDLPLENVTWRVSLSDLWKVRNSSGSLRLQRQETRAVPAALDLEGYLQTETAIQNERTRKAEELLASGNSALAQGDPQQARRAFQAAYGLSSHDSAFNEDARVQLHNLKLQQALVGLNVRQSAGAGDAGALAGKIRELRSAKELNYSQQDAKDLIDRNTADDNAAYQRLAERLIQQQDAAMSSPTALHASIPEQSQVLTFARAIVVDPWADLQIRVQASQPLAAGGMLRGLILTTTLAFFAALSWVARKTFASSSTVS